MPRAPIYDLLGEQPNEGGVFASSFELSTGAATRKAASSAARHSPTCHPSATSHGIALTASV
jgi:hypothetical protein